MGFPPLPSYPVALDSNFSLYLVYNTTQSTLSSDNLAYSQEIDIVPQSVGDNEIWPSNGFATISGELFYYDAVDLDSNGYVKTLKRCIRNIGGEQTRYNATGIVVMGMVVAEHHNQLAQAVQQIENFVGINFSPDETTLDWRIRHLAEQLPCQDDGNCPSVNFNYSITSVDICIGTTISYNLSINGNFNSFQLSFGDGNISTNPQSGTHTYAPNATIDPVVSVSNNDCSVVVSGVIRTSDNQPTVAPVPTALTVLAPQTPVIPVINVIPTSVPSISINIPPVVFPCLDFVGPSISIGNIGPIPPFISIQNPNIPSQINVSPSLISVVGLEAIPSIISFTPSISIPNTISFLGATNIPSIISVTGTQIPSVITVDSNIPTTITINSNLPTVIETVWTGPTEIPVVFTGIGGISIPIDWSHAPSCISVCCCSSSTTPKAFTSGLWEDGYTDDFNSLDVATEFSGIPSTIDITMPDTFPTEIQLTHNLPSTMELNLIGMEKIPSEIKFKIPKNAIPQQIEIAVPDEFPKIQFDTTTMPKIQIDGTSLIPSVISLVQNTAIPSIISLDASSLRDISLIAPSAISLEVPDIKITIENPEVKLVQTEPIKIDWSSALSSNLPDGTKCFALVPCGG